MKLYVTNNKLCLFKNNVFKYILVFILFFGIFIFSCKHDIQQPEVKQTTEAILSVDEAQKWFEAQADSAITLKSGRVGKSLELKNDWRYALESQNDTLGVVDVDILAKGRFSFLDNDGKRVFENTGNEKYLNSLSRLVVRKNKKNGRIESFVMTLIASPEYLEKQNFDLTKSTYLKRLKDFTGLVLYYSVSGEFVNGWKYAQGKVIGKGSQTVANNSPLVLKKAECVCVTVTMYNQFCTDWFDMGGHYIFTNCEARTTDYEFYYLFCAYVSDSDGNSNGGGGEYNPPEPPTTPPTKPLPLFSSLKTSFALVAGMTAPQVYQKVRGNVYSNYLREPLKYNNACALRLSYALNMSPGHAIPFIQDVTVSGDTNSDGVKEWYFLTVSSLVEYLKSVYGDCKSTNTNAIQGKTGIIWQSDCPWIPSATGHVDVWDQNNAVDHYYNDCNDLNFWGY